MENSFERGLEVSGSRQMRGKRLCLEDGCMKQCADDVLLSYTLETCIVLLTNDTRINSIEIFIVFV